MKLTVLAKRVIPNFETRLAIRRALFSPLDILDLLAGRRDPLMPPRGLWFVGGGHFRENQLLDSFIRLCDLRPDHHVLDVGCGIGKQAVPLTSYLSSAGSYDGFDVVKEGIKWCRAHISTRFPNFRFQRVDLFNKHYNPRGKFSASEWKFPYPDSNFDFACVVSVFTHMLPDGIQNYIQEIARVLKPGSKALMTFLLLNDSARYLVEQGRSTIALTHEFGNYSVMDPLFPETSVGVSEECVRKWCLKSGLNFDSISYGTWCGREGPKHYQDIVVAARG